MTLDVVADTELLDELAVLLDVALLDVLQHTAALTDEHHEAATGVVVLLVRLQVLGEVADALREDGDLNLGGTGVLIVLAELLDEFRGALLGDAELAGHSWSTFLSRGLPRLRRVRGLPFPSVLGSHGSGPWEPKANSAAVLAARPV